MQVTLQIKRLGEVNYTKIAEGGAKISDLVYHKNWEYAAQKEASPLSRRVDHVSCSQGTDSAVNVDVLFDIL